MWFPLLVIFTPSPAKSVQSILFALMAPVRYGTLDNPILEPTLPKPTSTDKSSKSASAAKDEIADPRRSGVSGGDTIRDCAIIEYVPHPRFIVWHYADPLVQSSTCTLRSCCRKSPLRKDRKGGRSRCEAESDEGKGIPATATAKEGTRVNARCDHIRTRASSFSCNRMKRRSPTQASHHYHILIYIHAWTPLVLLTCSCLPSPPRPNPYSLYAASRLAIYRSIRGN